MKRLALLAVVLAAGSTGAQTVWRCGPDGRDYRDAPCPEGRVVAVADERGQADRASTAAVVARDRALARELVRERHERERERKAAGNGLAGFATTGFRPAATPSSSSKAPKRPRPATPGTSPAADPSSRFAKG